MLRTLAIVVLVSGLLGRVSARVLHTPPSLGSRALSVLGEATFLSPNSATIVSQCGPLDIQFTSPSAPQNFTLFIAVNNVPVAAGFWPWLAPPNGTWKDSTTVTRVIWNNVAVSGGSVMWGELHDYDGGVSYLLGDGVSVQNSNITSCLAQDAGSQNYVGDPEHVEQGVTMSATVIAASTSSAAPSTSSLPPTTPTSTPPTTSPTASLAGAIVSNSVAPSSISATLSSTPSSSATAAAGSLAAKSTNTGAIAGGVSVVAVVVIAGVLVFLFLRRRKQKNAEVGRVEESGEKPDPNLQEDVAGYEAITTLHRDPVQIRQTSYDASQVPVWNYTSPATSLVGQDTHPSLPTRLALEIEPLPPAQLRQEVDVGHLDGETIPPSYGNATGAPGALTHSDATSTSSTSNRRSSKAA